MEEKGTLGLDAAAALVLNVAKVVSVAHKQSILHRDLKPDNLIVRNVERNDIVVIDYGLSYSESDDDLTRTTETIRNKFLDLPENNTPDGNRRDSRSDITHLCGILYFCLTGNKPGHLQSADGGRPPHRRPGYSIQEKLGSEPRIRRLEMFFDCGFMPSNLARYSIKGERIVLVFLVVASCALLTAVLALALLREIRLRRALEAILKRILNTWRRFHASDEPDSPRNTGPDSNLDDHGRL